LLQVIEKLPFFGDRCDTVPAGVTFVRFRAKGAKMGVPPKLKVFAEVSAIFGAFVVIFRGREARGGLLEKVFDVRSDLLSSCVLFHGIFSTSVFCPIM
jgi:hypothetical protein